MVDRSNNIKFPVVTVTNTGHEVDSIESTWFSWRTDALKLLKKHNAFVDGVILNGYGIFLTIRSKASIYERKRN